MENCARYIAALKTKFGDPRMSDQALGDRLGYIQSNIARAKSGSMSDPMAIKIAEALGVPPGEILMVARMERERDPAVRAHLESWVARVGKALASVPATVVRGVAVLTMALGFLLPAHDARAMVGGAGGFRRRT